MSLGRVLIVDDQEDIREMARIVLAGAGYDAEVARSGDEALRLLHESVYDLVLLDIDMPELDGWATLRLLRADEGDDPTRVAMFSVKGDVRDKVASLKEGAIDYITKPFGVDELVRRVGRILHPGGTLGPAVPTASPR
ncbi:MAG TPA: response regulator transcription factor [Candidatus Polarisedimenticolaceae bacterium]|nr:response regulator transcription factor [Candidatus Polarisedimenticolaceae bacterium]